MSTISKPAFTNFLSNASLDVETYLGSPAVVDALNNAPDADQAAAAKFPDTLRALAPNGTISTPDEAAQLFDAIDTLDHNHDPASIDSDTAVKLAEEAKQMAALQQLHNPFDTTPSDPPDDRPAPVQPDGGGDNTGPLGAVQLGAGAQTMPVLSEVHGAPRFHQAPNGQPLTGLKSYAQITVGGQTAAQIIAKADFDSDGSPNFSDSGTHSDDTSMHFHSGGRRIPVNGEKVPYVVLPPEIEHKTGAKLGDLVQVTFQGQSTFAIFADGGPLGKVGELSGAAARAVAIVDDGGRRPISGNDGRDTRDVTYTVLAGSGAKMGIVDGGAAVSADDIQTKGEQAFREARDAGLFT
jgi:hypothetical protein